MTRYRNGRCLPALAASLRRVWVSNCGALHPKGELAGRAKRTGDKNAGATRNGRVNRRFPAKAPLPLAALLAALALAPAGCNREHKVTVKETVEEAPGKARIPVLVNMGDPKQEKQLVSGFYGIEANAWRWTAKDFTVSLRPPTGSAAQGATLVFALSIPQVTIDKLKSVTLSASIGGTALTPETYAHDGQYEFKRDVPSNLLTGDAVRVEFHLDKSMPPAGGDSRELGIVARSVALESK